MYEIILKYLSSLYLTTKDNEIKEISIDTKVYGKELVKEIIDIFQISDVVSTACIEIWIYDNSPTFDTKVYWEDIKPRFGNGIMPIIHQVAARTISLDLIRVQPMNSPSSTLNYINYNADCVSAITQSMGVPADRLGQSMSAMSGSHNTIFINE